MRRWLTRLAVPAAIVAAGLFSLSPAAWATAGTTVKWTGNGTNADGTCKDVGSFDDLNPGPNQQGWLFILTSPFDTNAGSDLTFLFDPTSAQDSTSPVAGVLQGNGSNGSFHFVVYSSIGAKLVSASATNGSETSVLTVSHCEQGSSTPPPSSPPVTTPPATTTPPRTTTPPATTPGVPSSTSGGGSHLPTTGIALTGFIVAGLALIGGGLAALMIARRRNDANPTEI